MFLIATLYVWAMEPFAWQKEASARSLVGSLGQEYVLPEHRHFTANADCTFRGYVRFPEDSPMMPQSALICTFESPCNATVERQVWHRQLMGSFTSAEPLSWTIAEVCREMLLPEVLANMGESRGG
jgi:hypothetical protein